MRLNIKPSRILAVLVLIIAAYTLKACQVFIHDSFDTFQGVIVDETGNPVPNLRLRLYPSSGTYFSGPRQGSGNVVVTNATGEFKSVFPSRNMDAIYYLIPPSDLVFEVDQFGALTKVTELSIEPLPKDRNRVIDLGRITVVRP
ncbi:hypothetical protein [Algoriphagus litoralis]|uniref:hypothetical protein n=1 Tax=Algoriphagus litoralis TaxID=2202829 RepID=UPI000DBA06EA|nr:hypothetical protein [Algoriphagus litoralis]